MTTPPPATDRGRKRKKQRKASGPPGRKPSVGFLQPGARIDLLISPPMTDREAPVLFTPNPGDVVMVTAMTEPHRVMVENTRTDRMSMYAVTIVPKLAVSVAQVPWARVFRDFGAAVKDSGLPDLLKQVAGRLKR